MKYKEFCGLIKDKMGDVFWPMVGRLYSTYTPEHLKACLDKFPSSKRKESPKNKMIYFAGICRNSAGTTDILRG